MSQVAKSQSNQVQVDHIEQQIMMTIKQTFGKMRESVQSLPKYFSNMHDCVFEKLTELNKTGKDSGLAKKY